MLGSGEKTTPAAPKAAAPPPVPVQWQQSKELRGCAPRPVGGRGKKVVFAL